MSDSALRERKKAAIRAKVLEVAHGLFREDGFEGTTIEQICGGSLISKRTFFRYFRDKESLVFPQREERLTAFVHFLNANKEVENPFDSLRLATHHFGSRFHKHKARLKAQQTMVGQSGDLLSREREIDLDWQRAIATALSERAGQSPADDLWARVAAGAIMGVVRSTTNFWFEHGCKDDLTELGLNALEYLEKGFPTRAGTN